MPVSLHEQQRFTVQRQTDFRVVLDFRDERRDVGHAEAREVDRNRPQALIDQIFEYVLELARRHRRLMEHHEGATFAARILEVDLAEWPVDIAAMHFWQRNCHWRRIRFVLHFDFCCLRRQAAQAECGTID